jgi:hypothetical protein
VHALLVLALTLAAGVASRLSSHPLLYLGSAVVSYLGPSWIVVYRVRDSAVGPGDMRLLRRAWLFGLVTLWLLR